jgi:hypothetical protein
MNPENPKVFMFDPRNGAYLEGKRQIQPAPNELPWHTAFLFLLLIGSFGVIPLLLHSAEEHDLDVDRQLHREGVEASAFVVSCTPARGNASIAYRYPVPNSTEVYRGRGTIGGGDCAVYGSGRRVSILYLPDSPGQSKLADDSPRGSGAIVYLGVSGAFFLVAVLGGGAEVRTARRRQRLAKQGRLLTGVITHVEQSFTVRWGYNLHVTYNFTTPDGNLLSGEQSSPQQDNPKVNTPIYVLYVNDELFRAL